MPKLTAQEKLEKKRQLEEKREARRLAKEKKESEKAAAEATSSNDDDTINSQQQQEQQQEPSTATTESSSSRKGECFILTLSEDSLNHILWFLSARDLGALTLTCRQLSKHLVDGRVSYVWARLNHTTNNNNASSNDHRRSYIPVECAPASTRHEQS